MKTVIMNMSGVYEAQEFYRQANVPKSGITIMDCRDIQGTNCYLDDLAKEELRGRIQEAADHKLHFIDSGNYHYLTLLFMELIREDFGLVLWDNHPDFQQPMFGNITSCGGWVREALDHLPHLKQVIILGVEQALVDQLEEEQGIDERVHVVRSWKADGTEWNRGELTQYLKEYMEELPVYMSVDKDLLSEKDAACNWSQGITSQKQLLDEMGIVLAKSRVLGLDICGECEDPLDSHSQTINDKLNRRMMDFLRSQE